MSAVKDANYENVKEEDEDDSVLVTAKLTKSKMKGVDGYQCNAPLPFVKGEPADFLKMTPVQLRRFFTFAYKSVFERALPKLKLKLGREKVPTWWPVTVNFDEGLKIVMIPKAKDVHSQRRELTRLLEAFYGSLGLQIFLVVAQHLNNSDGRSSLFRLDRENEPWAVVSKKNGKLIMYIDRSNRVYDKKFRGAGPYKIEDEELQRSFVCNYCKREYAMKEFCEDHEAVCVEGPRGSVAQTQKGFMQNLDLENVDVDAKPGTSRQLLESSKHQKPVHTWNEELAERRGANQSKTVSVKNKSYSDPISSRKQLRARRPKMNVGKGVSRTERENEEFDLTRGLKAALGVHVKVFKFELPTILFN